MNNMYINENELTITLDKLKNEKERMSKVFTDVENSIKDIPLFYSGETATEVNEKLSNHIKIYSEYIDNINNYISFLENTLNDYKLKNNSFVERL